MDLTRYLLLTVLASMISLPYTDHRTNLAIVYLYTYIKLAAKLCKCRGGACPRPVMTALELSVAPKLATTFGTPPLKKRNTNHPIRTLLPRIHNRRSLQTP